MNIEPLAVIDRNTKEVELIPDYKDLVVKDGVNKYDPLTFYLPKTIANSNAFVLIENENFIEFEGHQYRIKQSNEYLRGSTPVKVISNARHRFYDILDIQKYTSFLFIIEADHTQKMIKNEKKIEKYKQLIEVGAISKKSKFIWITTTEYRREKLKHLCEGLDTTIFTVAEFS